MELGDYVRIVRQRVILIVGCIMATVAVAALVTIQMTPQYSSSARLFVSTLPSDTGDAYQGSLFSAQRVQSYADLVSGRELAGRVIDELRLQTEPQDLSEKVTATVVPETVILELSVTDPSPQRAQRLAQAYAIELTEFVADLETPPGRRVAPIKASIVDAAAVPSEPVSPQPLRNIGLAAILGLLLGLGAAVVRELLDTSVTSQEDITAATGTAIMGTIAFDGNASKHPLITSLDSHAPRVEAFRVLRTNLQFLNVDSPSKVFVVTSSVPEEGKTTTACNLAVTLAQGGNRVILVEGDMRRPKISEHFTVEAAVGLTTVLVGRLGLDDAVQPSGVPGLMVLPSGTIPPNPAELIQSHAMTDVLKRLRTHFDVIIIDAPPLLPVTDAALLTSQADGALLVVKHGKTSKDQVHHSVERLEAVGARLLGAVLNMVPSRRSGDTYYGYGYGYAPRPGRRAKSRDEVAAAVERDDEPFDQFRFTRH